MSTWRPGKIAVALAALTLGAVGVRVLVAPASGGLVDVDADLHLRRALLALARGANALRAVDPMIAWPDGARVDWPPAFDMFLAGLAALCGDRFERAAALAIPMLGALAIPVAYKWARTVLGSGGALLAAGVVALLPAHVELTRVGRVDHHVLEPTFLWLGLSAVASGEAFAAGIALLLLFMVSPTGLIGAALMGAAGLWRLRHRPRLAVPAAVLLLAAGAAVAARAGAFQFAGKQGLVGTIVESRSLFAFGWVGYPALAPLTVLGLLAPVAVALRRGRDDARVIMGGAAVLLLGLTMVQRRFMHLAALPVAVVWIDAAIALDRRVLVGAAAALGAIPSLFYFAESPPESPRVLAVRALAPALRALPPGGVLCQWPYGHIIARVGQHPVVASPLLTPATEAAAEDATRALLDDDPERLRAWMVRRHTRYVVATALPPDVTARYLTALADGRSPAAVEKSALVARLAAGVAVPGLHPLAASADGLARLYVLE